MGVILLGVVGIAAAEPASSATANSAPLPIATAAPTPTPPNFIRPARFRKLQRKLEDANAQIAAYREEAKRTREAVDDYHDYTANGVTILAFLLGAVGLVLPLINYLTTRNATLDAQAATAAALRATEASNKVLASLEERFRTLNNAATQERLNAAIANLNEKDKDNFFQGINFLKANPDLEFSEHQLKNICDAGTNPFRASIIVPLVSRYRSPTIQNFLRDCLEREDTSFYDTFLQAAAQQANDPGAATLREFLKERLTSQGEGMFRTVDQASELSPMILKEVLNDDKFLKRCSVYEKLEVLSRLRKEDPGTLKLVNASRLADQVGGRFFLPSNTGGETQDLEKAECFTLYVDGERQKSVKRDELEFEQFRNEAILRARPTSSKPEAPPRR